MRDDYRSQLARQGYIVLRSVLAPDEVQSVRQVLRKLFAERYGPSKRSLIASEALQVPEVYLLAFRPRIVQALKVVLGEHYAMLANFNVQRNQYGGWHTDAGSEGNGAHLLADDYRFIKCGIYLQDDSAAWGGAIKVVSGGHRFPVRIPDRDMTFRLQRLSNRVRQKYFSSSPGLKAGDFIAFDYRLPHSATWPSKQNRGKVENGMMLGIPDDKTKLTIYWDAGSADCARRYLEHIAGRAEREEAGGQALEPFFSDYLQLEYPGSYPADFVAAASEWGIHIAARR